MTEEFESPMIDRADGQIADLPVVPTLVSAARAKAKAKAKAEVEEEDAAKSPEGPPALKGKKARHAASAEASGFYRCYLPADPTMPARVVQAQTPGDAERVYREESGVVTFGHPVNVSDAAPHAE